MRIYTRRGDEGETDLRSGERVPKSSHRIEAYGTVDEANARLGVAVSLLEENGDETDDEEVIDAVKEIQNTLFKTQADLANTNKDEDEPRVTETDVERVEALIDIFNDELEPLTTFILPGGSRAGATVHDARSVVRRAERRVVALDEEISENEEVDNVSEVLNLLNRVSDLLFVLARFVNSRAGVEEKPPTY